MRLEGSPPDWRHDPVQRDKLIKRMVELLREGHRMLNEVCPRCGAILFYRKDVGLKYCPNCDIFLASPEELEKVDTSKINIVGSFEGGRIVKYREHIAGQPLPFEVKLESRISDKSGAEEIRDQGLPSDLYSTLVVMIMERMQRIAKYEIERMNLLELLTAFKLILEIKNMLGEK